MTKYRKKPIVIEAIQWTGRFIDVWTELEKWGVPTSPGEMATNTFFINTLGGKMKVIEGDWIIKGVNGEFYPCKPDIFEKTYELIQGDTI